MPGFNFCFMVYIQVSHEAGPVVWYSHLCKNFPQLIVIYSVKGFWIVIEADVHIFFWNSFAFSVIQQMLVIWIGLR